MKFYPSDGTSKRAERFQALVTPHIEYLYRVAYRLCGEQFCAEDLVQELLSKLFPKTDEMLNLGSVRHWMTAALSNLFVDKIRQQKRLPVDLADSELEIDELNVNLHASPETDLEKFEDINRVQKAFDQLNEDHRVLITLHDIEGYTLPEIEAMLQVPLGTLKSRLHRARHKLNVYLCVDENSREPFELNERVSN